MAALSNNFPILARPGLVYLDSAATTQKPAPVIETLSDFYRNHNANVHRGIYPLALEADELYAKARQTAASFVGGVSESTIFTANTTAAINLVASSWGDDHIGQGDAIVLTAAEHHSNIIPWQMLCQRRGAKLCWLDVDEQGQIDLDQLSQFLEEESVKLVALAHISNVLGTINPVAEVASLAHEVGALLLVDGAQAVAQTKVDLDALGADFYVWGAHKAYGPTGVGFLHARPELLNEMRPFLVGGGMISSVSRQGASWASIPDKFEAGTPPIAEAVAAAAALDYLDELGLDEVRRHSVALTDYLLSSLAEFEGLHVIGPSNASERGGIVSFSLDYAHAHDVAEIVARHGVAVRAGHHCAQPLMQSLDLAAVTRASLAVHNSESDIDTLIAGLGEVESIFRDGA